MIDVRKLRKAERVIVRYMDAEVDSEFVKAFRKKYGLTQIALANILGVTKKTIEKWEQGVNKIKGSSAVLLKLLHEDESLLDRIYNIRVATAESDGFEVIRQSETTQKIYSAPALKIVARQRGTGDHYGREKNIKFA